jgi:predicted extracellular nuclease
MSKVNNRIFNLTVLGTLLTSLSLLITIDRNHGLRSLEVRAPKEVTVAFYNVENLFDTINDPNKDDEDFTPQGKYGWNTERYQHKLVQLAKVISSISDELPMIVGLSEVENEAVLRDLIAQEALKKGGYEIIHFESLDERGIDVAMLYRKKYFKPEHVETLFVNLGTDQRPTRDILYVNGKLKGGALLHVLINHWPSRYGGQEQSEPKRMAAASVARKAVDAIITDDANAAVLLMGDFNDYPDNKSIQEVLSAKGTNDSGLLVNLLRGKETELRGTYNYRGDWGFLDQIIVSRSMYEGGVVMVKPEATIPHSMPWMLFTDPKYGDEKPNRTFGGPEYYGGFSDHLPVKTVLLY